MLEGVEGKMCGVVGIFDIGEGAAAARLKALRMASLLRHRGPDWSGVYADGKAVLAHERLSIVDVEHGDQPLVDSETERFLVANGEIYNHVELAKTLKGKHAWKTRSDCEVLLYLYDEFGAGFLNELNGIFAFIIYDKEKNEYFIARDHLGICPLYVGWDERGTLYTASEMKSLDKICKKIQEFPPGSYYHSRDKQFIKWYNPAWANNIPATPFSLQKLREELEAAVKRQLMSDVPYGVLISGGLDSSIIAAIASKYRKKRIETNDREEAWWPRLHSFAIGLQESPDLKYARKVADYLGTVHHEIIYTVQEGLDAVKQVVYHLETFDVTTIRAATPMYLMARKIRSNGIKMVLSGEGSDEVFGGYLYFHMAPNAREFHEETVRKLFALSKYDCLRANKSTAAWGVEARVPFLDRQFLNYAMSIDPEYKMCPGEKIEKRILREAFEGFLPEEILWRQKEQFSDGVGYNWISQLKAHGEEVVSDEMMAHAEKAFPMQTPPTKEAYYYRQVFDDLFTNPTAASTVPTGPSIACSTPTAFRWSKEFEKMNDPSGRAVKSIHQNAVEKV